MGISLDELQQVCIGKRDGRGGAVEHNAGKLILGNFNILPPQQICTNPAVIMEQPIAMMADEAIKLVTRLLNNGKPEQLVFGSEVILAPQQKAVAN